MNSGQDNWRDMNAEQRARLIRDMPMERDEDATGSLVAWPVLILAGIMLWTLLGGLFIHWVQS